MQYGLQEKSDCARQFIEIMFAFDLEKVVVERLWEYKCKLDEPNNSFYTWQILNFDDLFIQAGNRSLFLKLDAKTALELYLLTMIEWRIDEDSPDYSDNKELPCESGRKAFSS